MASNAMIWFVATIKSCKTLNTNAMSRIYELSKTESHEHISNVRGMLLVRIALSPFIFLWGLFQLFALTFFPLQFVVPFSAIMCIGTPFLWLLKKGGTKIDYVDSFIEYGHTDRNAITVMRNHFLGATIHLWGAFYVAYYYIVTGKIYNGD